MKKRVYRRAEMSLYAMADMTMRDPGIEFYPVADVDAYVEKVEKLKEAAQAFLGAVDVRGINAGNKMFALKEALAALEENE